LFGSARFSWTPACACVLLALAAAPAPAAHLALGVADQPGGAARLRGLDQRYQYLAGGVNTGGGWATWNPGGSFVSRYVADSRAARVTPVFTYYQLLQSKGSCAGGAEDAVDLCHLRDGTLMRAYWADLELFFRRARGRSRVILHVEPDLWGYLQQHGERALATGFARRVLALRDRFARNVQIAYHDSVWGTKEDPTLSKPSTAHMAALGARSARFYRSLRARFDLVFHDVADRDAGFREKVLGDGGASAWTAADFVRRNAYLRALRRGTHRPVVVWQVPLGNSALDQTWTHFRDNRVEYWLGSRAHLRALRDAGVVALLFGAGAEGCTTAQTDGGTFFRLARAYERAPLRLR
jgi:hypothetical protein